MGVNVAATRQNAGSTRTFSDPPGGVNGPAPTASALVIVTLGSASAGATAVAAPGAVWAGRRERLLLLQVGRALTAIGVAASHARLGTSAFVEPIPGWLMAILEKGFLGVDFFFVLSGFIILNSHFDDDTGPRALRSYVFKRVTRIYVPYLPVCAVVIASYLLLPSLSAAIPLANANDGGPQFWGVWSLPSIPAFPEIFSRFANSGVISVRKRVK